MLLQGSSGSGVSQSTPLRVIRYALNPSAVDAFTNTDTMLGR